MSGQWMTNEWRAWKPEGRLCSSWSPQMWSDVEPTRSGVVNRWAVAAIAPAALSAPASASATPGARWTAETRTTAESGATRAWPWPVTVTVRMHAP